MGDDALNENFIKKLNEYHKNEAEEENRIREFVAEMSTASSSDIRIKQSAIEDINNKILEDKERRLALGIKPAKEIKLLDQTLQIDDAIFAAGEIKKSFDERILDIINEYIYHIRTHHIKNLEDAWSVVSYYKTAVYDMCSFCASFLEGVTDGEISLDVEELYEKCLERDEIYETINEVIDSYDAQVAMTGAQAASMMHESVEYTHSLTDLVDTRIRYGSEGLKGAIAVNMYDFAQNAVIGMNNLVVAGMARKEALGERDQLLEGFRKSAKLFTMGLREDAEWLKAVTIQYLKRDEYVNIPSVNQDLSHSLISLYSETKEISRKEKIDKLIQLLEYDPFNCEVYQRLLELTDITQWGDIFEFAIRIGAFYDFESALWVVSDKKELIEEKNYKIPYADLDRAVDVFLEIHRRCVLFDTAAWAEMEAVWIECQEEREEIKKECWCFFSDENNKQRIEEELVHRNLFKQIAAHDDPILEKELINEYLYEIEDNELLFFRDLVDFSCSDYILFAKDPMIVSGNTIYIDGVNENKSLFFHIPINQIEEILFVKEHQCANYGFLVKYRSGEIELIRRIVFCDDQNDRKEWENSLNKACFIICLMVERMLKESSKEKLSIKMQDIKDRWYCEQCGKIVSVHDDTLIFKAPMTCPNCSYSGVGGFFGGIRIEEPILKKLSENASKANAYTLVDKSELEVIRKASCKKCGKLIRRDAFFCTKCGENNVSFSFGDIFSDGTDKKENQECEEKKETKTNGTQIVCEKCGKVISVNANFCTKCGNIITKRISSN